MLMLLGLSDRYGFDIAAFQHALEAYKIADEIAAHGVGASTFSDWWAYKYEVVDAIPYNGAILLDHGVVTSYNSDDDELARRLNTEAAKAVRYGGVGEEEALGLVTIGPATQLGVDRRVGSLEPGKDADFVIWSGNPLSTYSLAEQTWIDGRRYFDRAEDLERRAELAAERDCPPGRGRSRAYRRRGRAGRGRGERRGDRRDGRRRHRGGGAGEARPEETREAGEAEATAVLSEDAGRADAAPTPAPLPATGDAVAFVGGTVHPVSSAPIEGATVLIRGDRIVAVGTDVAVPDDARVIDATGEHLYPGFIHPEDHPRTGRGRQRPRHRRHAGDRPGQLEPARRGRLQRRLLPPAADGRRRRDHGAGGARRGRLHRHLGGDAPRGLELARHDRRGAGRHAPPVAPHAGPALGRREGGRGADARRPSR